MNGTLRTVHGRPVLRIERRLDHSIEKVWRAITEPDQIGQWYPFQVAQMDFRVGGTILFDDGDGTQMKATILELDPPRVFAFSEHAPESMERESDDLVHIELRSESDGCLLIFTHTFDDRPAAASYATGWNACLDALRQLLAGEPVEFNVDWARGHESFIQQLGLTKGSVLDGQDGWTVRFERQLTKPAGDVWSSLTASDSAAPGKISSGDPPPDAATISSVPAGPVTRIDPTKSLEYEWMSGGQPAGRVRWELTEGTGHGARLVLTQTGPSSLKDVQSAALSGWEAHVERLARQLAGVDNE